jgi:hypothetical protein
VMDFVPGEIKMEHLNDVSANDETDSRDLAPNLPQNYRMTRSRDSSIRSGSVFMQRDTSLRSHDDDGSHLGDATNSGDDESSFMGSVASASRSIFSGVSRSQTTASHPWEQQRGANDPLRLSNRSVEPHAARKPWGSGTSGAGSSTRDVNPKQFGGKGDALDLSTRSNTNASRHHQGQAKVAHTMAFSFSMADPAQLKRSHSPTPPPNYSASSVFSSLMGYATESDTEKKFYNDHASSDDDMSQANKPTFASLFRLQEEEVEDDFEHTRIKEGIELSRQKNKPTRKTAYEIDNPRASTLVVKPDVGMNGTSTDGDGWKNAKIGQELEEDSSSGSHGDTSIDSLDELLHPELVDHRPGQMIHIEQESIASLEESLTALDVEHEEMESSQVTRDEAEEELSNLDHVEAVINTFNEILEKEEEEQRRLEIAMQESLPSLNSIGSLIEDLPSDDDGNSNLALKTYVTEFMDSMDYTLKHPPKAKLSDLFIWSEKKNVDVVERTKQKRIEVTPAKEGRHISSADALFRPAEESKQSTEGASDDPGADPSPRAAGGWSKIGGSVAKRNDVAMRTGSVKARAQSTSGVAPALQNESPGDPKSVEISKNNVIGAAKVPSDEFLRTPGVSPEALKVVEALKVAGAPKVVEKKRSSVEDRKELSSVPVCAKGGDSKVPRTSAVPKSKHRAGILETPKTKSAVVTAPQESAPTVKATSFLNTEPAVRKSQRFERDLEKETKGDKIIIARVRKIEEKAPSVKILQPQESAPPALKRDRAVEAGLLQTSSALSGERGAIAVDVVGGRQKSTAGTNVDESVPQESANKGRTAEADIHESQKVKPSAKHKTHVDEGKPRVKTAVSAPKKSKSESIASIEPLTAEPVRRKSRKDDATRLEAIPMSIVTSDEGGDIFTEGLERHQPEPDTVTTLSPEGGRKNGSKPIRQIGSASSSDNSFVASANSSRHSRSNSSRGIDLDDANKPSSLKRRSTANGTKSSSTGSHRRSKRGQEAVPQQLKPDLLTAFNKNSSSFRRADVESKGTQPVTSSIMKDKESSKEGERSLSLSISPEEVLMALMGGSLSKAPPSNSKTGSSPLLSSKSATTSASTRSPDRSTQKKAMKKTRLEYSASSESRGSRASLRDSSPTIPQVSSRSSGEHRSSRKSSGTRRSTRGDSEVSGENREKRVSFRGTSSSRVSSSATKVRGVDSSEKLRASEKSNGAEASELVKRAILAENPVTRISSSAARARSPEISRKHRSSRKGDDAKDTTPVEHVAASASRASVALPCEPKKLGSAGSATIQLQGSESNNSAKVSTSDEAKSASKAPTPPKKMSSRVKSVETKEPVAVLQVAEVPKRKSSKIETTSANAISTGDARRSNRLALSTPQASAKVRRTKSSDSVRSSSSKTRSSVQHLSSKNSASRVRRDASSRLAQSLQDGGSRAKIKSTIDQGVRSDDDDSIDISKPVFRKAPSRPKRASAKSIQITPTSSGTQTTATSSHSGERKTRRAETSTKPTSSSPTPDPKTESKARRAPTSVSAILAPPVLGGKSVSTDRQGKKTRGRRSNSLPPNADPPKELTVAATQSKENKLRGRAGSMPPKVNTNATSRKSSRTPEQAKERRKRGM